MARLKLTTLPLADLIEDWEIYPRHAVDESHVGQLYLSLQSGTELPPPIVEAKTHRIVDGWHRVRAWRRHLGETGSILVDARSYNSPADLLQDAIALNSVHGRRFDKMDRTRAVLLLQRAGVKNYQIAAVLRVPESSVIKLTVNVARSPIDTKATVPGTRQIILKRPMAHLRQTELTAAQARAHDTQPGTHPSLLIRQLREAMEHDLLNKEDAKLMGSLRELQIEIGTYLDRSLVAA